MDRLTYKKGEHYYTNDSCIVEVKSLSGNGADVLLDCIDKLGEYEDAEEQGLLPKFHLGDEFWTSWLGKPLKAKIVMLQQKKNGLWKYRFCDEQSNTHDYAENEFGKYFWTTKEEAEQALKQMGE